MNPEIKAKWVAALRSGDYQKGTGSLHSESYADDKVVHQFCCLGVLCELAVEAGVVDRVRAKGTSYDDETLYKYGVGEVDLGYYGASTFPPVSVCDWAGLSTGDPSVADERHECNGDEGCTSPNHYVSLASLNDDRYDAFGPIANAIEQSDL